MIIVYSILTLGLLGLASGVLLAFAAKKFYVPVDPRVEQLTGILPGANCGACGYASCQALAKAVLKGEAAVNSCIAGSVSTAEKVAAFMGAKFDNAKNHKRIAIVRCKGGKDKAKKKFVYTGIKDCSAAQLIAGGHKMCAYGCLGHGNCVKVCPFDAIDMGADGIPVVNEDRCTACGKCVAACPRKIIELTSFNQAVYLACVSRDKGKKVKDACSVGCIACGICVKPEVSSQEVITMGGNLPEIHWKEGLDLKKLLENAVKKCPCNCFSVRGK